MKLRKYSFIIVRMSTDLLLAFTIFASVSLVTPGPNNLMLMASGANFGFRRTIPHMLGVCIGFAIMVGLVGGGLIGIFDAWPTSHTVLKVVSVIYLCVLAWRIANADAPGEGRAGGRPLNFMQAAIFQWVNPKGWAIALTAVTVYVPGSNMASVLLIAVLFGTITMPAASSWILLGREFRRLLTNPTRLRVFNVTMALLLLASIWPVLGI